MVVIEEWHKYSKQEEEKGENNIIDPQQLNEEGLCLDNLYYGVSTQVMVGEGLLFDICKMK